MCQKIIQIPQLWAETREISPNPLERSLENTFKWNSNINSNHISQLNLKKVQRKLSEGKINKETCKFYDKNGNSKTNRKVICTIIEVSCM